MELVVVLTVLAAVAAIVLPLLPNLLRRAHKVTDATQSSEIAKAVQLYQGVYLGYPNEFDLMTVSTGTTPPTYLPIDGTPFGGAAVIGNLTADEVAALRRVGITSGHHFVASNPAHPTLDPYSAVVTAPSSLSVTSPVFLISSTSAVGSIPVELQNIIARDATARFVVFGIGSRCTMVGKVLHNAPTSVPQKGNFTPANTYSRMGVVFQVSGLGLETTERARFVGSVALEDDEIESTEKDLIGYYDIANSGE